MHRIPTYQVRIPEYRVETLKGCSGEMIRTYWGIPIPKEYEGQKPDFGLASSKIIACLRRHFLGKRIGFRLLGSMEHIDKTRAELIEIIKEIGHDRYDPARAGDRYENLEKKLTFSLWNSRWEEKMKKKASSTRSSHSITIPYMTEKPP